MTEKRFKLAFENFDGWAILDATGEYSDDEDYIDWLSGQKAVDVLNHFADENEQLKQQLQEEQCRTTPIVLDTHISDEDFKRIEEMLIKHFGKDGDVE